MFNKKNISVQLCFSSAVWYFTSEPRSWLWPGRQVSVCNKKLYVWLLILIWKVTVGEYISRTALLEKCVCWIYSGFILSWPGWLSRWSSRLLPAVRSCTVLWGLCFDFKNIVLWLHRFTHCPSLQDLTDFYIVVQWFGEMLSCFCHSITVL